jgi:hypothetical protein
MKNKRSEDTCKHPAHRIYAWFVPDARTGKDILCAACCDCGEVLAGGVTEEEMRSMDEPESQNR